MVVYTIECARCGATRTGRQQERSGVVRPYRGDCPECGGTDYSVPADE